MGRVSRDAQLLRAHLPAEGQDSQVADISVLARSQARYALTKHIGYLPGFWSLCIADEGNAEPRRRKIWVSGQVAPGGLEKCLFHQIRVGIDESGALVFRKKREFGNVSVEDRIIPGGRLQPVQQTVEHRKEARFSKPLREPI